MYMYYSTFSEKSEPCLIKKNFSLFVSLELKGVFQILVALSFLSSAIVIVTKTDSKK